MIINNLNIVKSRIAESCVKSNRDLSGITLIAVSKTRPIETILEAKNYGIIHFGENRAQEFRDKTDQVNDDLIWHFIGHLQTNKVKYVINKAEFIHSVESERLLKEINKQSSKIGKIQKIFLEVNIIEEESKFGLTGFDNIKFLAEKCSEYSNIKLVGLMTMAPFTDDEYILRKTFSGLRDVQSKLNDIGFELKELSMGMTNDYEIAIEEGATMLRIGTAIFGERDQS